MRVVRFVPKPNSDLVSGLGSDPLFGVIEDDHQTISVINGDPLFNGIAKNVAASVSVPTASTVTAYEWNHNGFTSGKFTVKVAAGTHTELSEVLVTSDTSNNIHFTEYGMVGTNGSLSTISADFNNNKIRIRVTTVNNNSTVVVAGTLIGA